MMRNPISLIVIITLVLSGCATTRVAYPPPLPKEARSRLGTIGVTHADFQPRILIGHKPRGKEIAAKAVGEEGKETMTGLAEVLPQDLGLAGVGDAAVATYAILYVLSIFAGATGVIVGAVEGVSEEDVEKAESDLNKALAMLNVQETMSDTVVKVAREKTGYNLVPVKLFGQDNMQAEPDYARLDLKDIDTLLTLEVIDIGFYGKRGANPLLEFSARARVRLNSVIDEKEIYSYIFIYAGKKRKFCDWSEDNARPLREEFDNFYRTTAEDIVDRLFVMDVD